MGTRTSQLQIRVTPSEKAALKRLAKAAGETLSSYVLSRALPSAELELAALMRRLTEPGIDLGPTLAELAEALEETATEDFAVGVPEPDVEGISPVLQNRIAGLVEFVANRRGIEPPDWTRQVPPLRRPFFHWSLTSLRPHQLLVTPVAFKRRNIFFDPATLPAPSFAPFAPTGERADDGGDAEAAPATGRDGGPHRGGRPRGDRPRSREAELMTTLAAVLEEANLKVEFYFIGGALLFQTFSARPASASVTDMFRPAAPVHAAVKGLAASSGLSDQWPLDCVRELLVPVALGGTAAYLEVPGVRVFEPLPEYALAMKCAAMRLGDDFDETEDVRYLLRATNVTSADIALATVQSYFAERQLSRDTRARLEAILPS